MLDINEIVKRLSDRNLKKVSEDAELSYDTVWRVANGKAKQPSYDTVRKLSDYLSNRQ